jgi:RecB family exonuclease
MTAYGIDAVPFVHKDLNKWRENFVGVQYTHPQTNFIITGAVDDIWINPHDELIVVDYKATSKDTEVNIDAAWQDSYKRQMEIYQWLLRKNSFTVSDTGYFVYCNARKDARAFDGKLEFDIKLIPYTGNDGWIEDVLEDIKTTLDSDALPAPSVDCEYCAYREAARKVED